jgi:hypothetical protein
VGNSEESMTTGIGLYGDGDGCEGRGEILYLS